MVQGGKCPGLAAKPAAKLRADAGGVEHELQRDVAVQLRVVRPVHDSHPAFADLFEHAVLPEHVAGFDEHHGP
jgi:hypothetical protein